MQKYEDIRFFQRIGYLSINNLEIKKNNFILNFNIITNQEYISYIYATMILNSAHLELE